MISSELRLGANERNMWFSCKTEVVSKLDDYLLRARANITTLGVARSV